MQFYRVKVEHVQFFEDVFASPNEQFALNLAHDDWSIETDNIVSTHIESISRDEFMEKSEWTEEDVLHWEAIYG